MRFNLFVVFFFTFFSLNVEACEGKLGVSREIEIDARLGFFTGQKSYRDTLNLQNKELVLTFDDGPLTSSTTKILKALEDECVKATFFLVGQMAKTHAPLVKRIFNEGHLIGTHSNTHPMTLDKLPFWKAVNDIENGITAVNNALGHEAAPFFRYPGFGDSPALNRYLMERNLAVFGAEIWIYDWFLMSSTSQLTLALHNIEKQGKGIVLFHDTRQQVADMLPQLLKELKARGYKIVHLKAKQNE